MTSPLRPGWVATLCLLLVGVVPLLGGCSESDRPLESPVRLEGAVFGSFYQVTLADSLTQGQADELQEGLTEVLEQVDAAMSIYRDDSELMTFNQAPLGEWQPLSNFNLVPILSVRDNITLPMRLAHQRVDKEWFKQITEILGISGRLKHLPQELSGGQQQRAAIARAMINRPEVLIADEPTGSLDSATSDAVNDLFRHVVDEFGQSLVFVTHDQDAARRGDHLVTMRDGQILSTEELPR